MSLVAACEVRLVTISFPAAAAVGHWAPHCYTVSVTEQWVLLLSVKATDVWLEIHNIIVFCDIFYVSG